MAKEKTNKKIEKVEETKVNCNDKYCPFHGEKKLKLRGRNFEGDVIKKTIGKLTIQLERMMKIEKYDRYEKRKTKIQARLPNCLSSQINVGDRVLIEETRPISKTIHFVVTKLIKQKL